MPSQGKPFIQKHCLGAFTRPFNFDNIQETLQKAMQRAQRHAQALLQNPMSKHIHTEAMARDMDLMRTVLGDAKLNYIGYSYGTWLGAWYASLFPERVGRMLLDSSMNVDAPFPVSDAKSSKARERLLNDIMLPYFARNLNMPGYGNDAWKIREGLLGMSAAAKNDWYQSLDFNDPAGLSASATQTNFFLTTNRSVPAGESLHEQLSRQLDAPAAGTSKLRAFTPASAVGWCVSCNDFRGDWRRAVLDR